MRKVWVPAILVVTGCMAAVGGPKGPSAIANISGVGIAKLVQTDSGLVIDLAATQLKGGDKAVHVHAVHIHPVGNCDPTNNYAAAGTHLNPAGKEHGLQNPKGPHAGDLPNIEISMTGIGAMHTVTKLVTLDELMDADGSSILIHANKDDYVSQPAGNSGAKIACGVIVRTK